MKLNYLSHLKMVPSLNLRVLKIPMPYEVSSFGGWLSMRLPQYEIGNGYGLKFYDPRLLITNLLLYLFPRLRATIISMSYTKLDKLITEMAGTSRGGSQATTTHIYRKEK